MGINRIPSRLDWINLLNRYIVAPRRDSAIMLNAINQIRVAVYTKLYSFFIQQAVLYGRAVHTNIYIYICFNNITRCKNDKNK